MYECIIQLSSLALQPSLCRLVLNFLTSRPLVIKVGQHLLYSLYTCDSVATSDSNILVKFPDYRAVVGLISDTDDSSDRSEIDHLVGRGQNNHLELNVRKTKELITGFSRTQQTSFLPLSIIGAPVMVLPLRLPGEESLPAPLPPQVIKGL